MSDPEINDGRRDFDFLIGEWRGRSRRLDTWLRGSDTWEEFDARLTVRHVLGGLGNVDEVTFDRAGGPARGMTLRLFSPSARQWSLYWADDRTVELFSPMIGAFTGGVGEFYGHEAWEGRWIYSRFIWSGITERTARWEQAFSVDGGKNWETNWVVDFTRLG